MSVYSELLKDPRWQKLRLEVFQRDNFKCLACLSTEKTLHVHHLHYVGGRKPWEYTTDELITVCEGCHERETALRKGNFTDDLKWYSLECRMPIWVLARIVHTAAFAFKHHPEIFQKYRDAHDELVGQTRFMPFTMDYVSDNEEG